MRPWSRLAPLLLGLSLAARAESGPAPEAEPLIRAPQAGEGRVALLAPRPFWDLETTVGLADGVGGGLVLQLDPGLFARALGQLRLRLWRVGPLDLQLRPALGAVLPVDQNGRSGIARTAEGELGLGLSLRPSKWLVLGVETGALGETDLSAERSTWLWQGRGEAELVWGPLSALARLGVLHSAAGERWSTAVGLGVRLP